MIAVDFADDGRLAPKLAPLPTGPLPLGAEQLVTLAQLRRAIGLSAMRVYLALLVRRDLRDSCRSSMTDVGLGKLQFRPCQFFALRPLVLVDGEPIESMTPRQIKYGRQRLRDFGLVLDEGEGEKWTPGGFMALVWWRQVFGERTRAGVLVPARAAAQILVAPGLGGVRRNAGGPRRGAGRPPKPEGTKAERASRAHYRPTQEQLDIAAEFFAPFTDADIAELDRQLNPLSKHEPKLTVAPVVTPVETPAPISTMSTQSKPAPILKLVPPVNAKRQPEHEQVMVRPSRSTPLRSLLLIGAGMPPPPENLPLVRVPSPPMLIASTPERTRRRLLASAWDGAVVSRYGKGCKMAKFGFGQSKRTKSVVDNAATALIVAEISPVVWCAWVLDMFKRCAPDDAPLPTPYVCLAVPTIEKHGEWCREEAQPRGGVVIPPACVELQRRWRACNDACRRADPSETKKIVAAMLPKLEYTRLRNLGAQQAKQMQREYNDAARGGVWIW